MSRFKVGDAIKHKTLGYVGTVKGVIGGGRYKTFWPCQGWGGNDPDEDLEPVAVAPATATLTIEAGKFYKTRDGRKVGPMERYAEFGDTGLQTTSRVGEFGSKLWIDDGRRYFARDRGGPSVRIAEWVDEPAAVAEATAAPTIHLDLEFVPVPQVGDAVLIPGRIAGITNSARGTNYNIVFETQNRRVSLHFLEEDFILDEDDDSGECVCANNDNGPLPSTDTARAFDALGDWLRSLAVERAA